MTNKRKLLLVAGARPNFMKIAPIIRALRDRADVFDYKLVHTGQHYDKEMSDVFFDELGIPAPDYHLDVGSGSHAEQTARVMVRFESVCLTEKADLVIVVGDINSTLACSIVAKKQLIPVAHIEAGLRSGDMAMPEEINRKVTDAIADYLFVTEKSGLDHLRAEGQPDSAVFFVGNVMIDNLFYQIEQLKHLQPDSLSSNALKRAHPTYGVVTLHRPSNVDNKGALQKIVGALTKISETLPLIFPIHPRTKANLTTYKIALPPTIFTIKPQPYMDFLNLFMSAKMVLTDSGGLQEETTALGVPCLTLRENTERPITLEEGTNVLAGTNPKRIVDEADKILRGQGRTGRKPSLWDGQAAKRIVQIIESFPVKTPNNLIKDHV